MIWTAQTDAELSRCFPVIRELRTHLEDEAAFLAQIRRQMAQGYRLTALEEDGQVRAAAGWRISENLAWGRFMYVDDLITRGEDRSKGYGAQLFDWLVAEARREGCAQFQLDSGVQRFGAHRFYLMHGMDITSHHFGLVL
jgi:GNAT superfamily N-acetyltransferase